MQLGAMSLRDLTNAILLAVLLPNYSTQISAQPLKLQHAARDASAQDIRRRQDPTGARPGAINYRCDSSCQFGSTEANKVCCDGMRNAHCRDIPKWCPPA